ncbi:MAG: S26 family signal peptidase [archaeon]
MALKIVLKILYILLIFSVGFLFGQIWDSLFYGGVTGLAVDMPSDFVDDEKIFIYGDRVEIKIEGAQLSTYDSTGSMLPTLGEGVNGISVRPESSDEIDVGDIVSFRAGDRLIVHRVVQKGADERGIFFVTKGDNSLADDGKLRFEEIERVLVALVY